MATDNVTPIRAATDGTPPTTLPSKPRRAKRARPPKLPTRAGEIDEQRYRIHQVKGICATLHRVFAHITEGHAPVDDVMKLAADAEAALGGALELLVDIDQKLGESAD